MTEFKIRTGRFIELHRSDEWIPDKRIAVCVDDIGAFSPERDGTCWVFHKNSSDADSRWHVAESFDEIRALIEGRS